MRNIVYLDNATTTKGDEFKGYIFEEINERLGKLLNIKGLKVNLEGD